MNRLRARRREKKTPKNTNEGIQTLLVFAKLVPKRFVGRTVREVDLQRVQKDSRVGAVGRDNKQEARTHRRKRGRVGHLQRGRLCELVEERMLRSTHARLNNLCERFTNLGSGN